jgi:hypothetical protein
VTAPVPPDFFDKLRAMVRQEVADAMRSGASRSMSITDGRFTVKGGALVLEAADGDTSFYLGGVTPALPDGTYQPGWIVYREDGSIAAAMYDPDPDPDGPGDYKQFFALYDRAGNVIISDDTFSGQGIARPYISGTFARTRWVDMTVQTASDTFETLWTGRVYKQHPRLEVSYRASMDATATTGETRVMVNGVQLGATATEGFAVATRYAGPAAVAGDHMAALTVEIQGRRTSATGTLRVEGLYWVGRQS